MHNFSIPASLKAWIDLVTRAGKTFSYTSSGPQGLIPAARRSSPSFARGILCRRLAC